MYVTKLMCVKVEMARGPARERLNLGWVAYTWVGDRDGNLKIRVGSKMAT